jgi:malate permease and related proteins
VTDISQLLNRILPIFLLLLLGNWARRSDFLAEDAVAALRKIVVNFALPAVLFLSFLDIELEPAYLMLAVLMFGLCLALFGLGLLIRRWRHVPHPYFPFLMTGFEYGMLGVALFGSAYGLQNIGYIAVVDLGHELFIWFVFLALLLRKRDNLTQPAQLLRAFITSPVIVGILAGLAFNALGAGPMLRELPVTGGIMATLAMLSNLTVPLILIIVGYGIKFDVTAAREAGQVTGIRLAMLIPLALLLNAVVLRTWLQLPPAVEVALFTLLIMPPPFIIPLYMRPGDTREMTYVNNTLTVYTVVSIVLFTIYFMANPWL